MALEREVIPVTDMASMAFGMEACGQPMLDKRPVKLRLFFGLDQPQTMVKAG